MRPTYYFVLNANFEKEIPHEEIASLFGEYANEVNLYSKTLKENHHKNIYKGYCFGGFNPTEPDKIYKDKSSGKVYRIVLRSYSKKILEELKFGFERCLNPYINVVSVSDVRTAKEKHITELKTLTPAIATVTEEGKTQPFILEKHGIKFLEDRIKANIEKKFKCFYGQEVSSKNLIKGIEILSPQPITTKLSKKYNSKGLLGYKFKIYVGDDYDSQQLAQLAIATGVLEKGSSLGAGFIEIH